MSVSRADTVIGGGILTAGHIESSIPQRKLHMHVGSQCSSNGVNQGDIQQ